MRARGFYRLEQQREQEQWRRTAWLAGWIVNMAGKYIKHRVDWRKLISFATPGQTKADMEKRRKEAEETFRLHKQKCWTKIRGGSLEKIVRFGDDPEHAKRVEQMSKQGLGNIEPQVGRVIGEFMRPR